MAEVRQVGVVGTDGDVAAATGELCIDHAGHVTGDGFSAQANMMATPDVWGAMGAAFEQSTGPLARRLLAALHAGEAAGGDARGRMSAALLVVEGNPPELLGAGVAVDLRVDRSDDPIGRPRRAARRGGRLRSVRACRGAARRRRSRSGPGVG